MCIWEETTGRRGRCKIDAGLVKGWAIWLFSWMHSWALEVFYAIQVASCFHGPGEDKVHCYRHHFELQVEGIADVMCHITS